MRQADGMGAALAIRRHIAAEELRRLARLEADGRIACRLLAIANALDGMSRAEAAHRAGMDRQTLRDWVIRFITEGIAGLADRPRSGRPTWLDDGELAALEALVLRGPDPERDGLAPRRAATRMAHAFKGNQRATRVIITCAASKRANRARALPALRHSSGVRPRQALLLGTHHGAVGRKHLPAYLDEFVSRFTAASTGASFTASPAWSSRPCGSGLTTYRALVAAPA